MVETTKTPSLWKITLIVGLTAAVIGSIIQKNRGNLKSVENVDSPAILTGTAELHNVHPKLTDTISSWITSDVDPSLMQGYERCTIERIRETDMTSDRFYDEFWRKKPVILLREEGINTMAQSLTQKETLLNEYSNVSIPLAKLESYSFRDEQSGSLKEYLDTISKQDIPTHTSRFAFSTDQFGVGNVYIVPKVVNDIPKLLDPSFQVAIAGSGTGLAFHWHGDVFAETLHGERRWFLFPPHTSPPFNPRSSSADWVRTIRSLLFEDQKLGNLAATFQECTIKQNQAIYVPADWFHSTLSLGEAVSITTSYASTYRQDRYLMEHGTSDNAYMLDAFTQRNFVKASQLAKKVISHRKNNFAPYSWLGVILTMDAMERHTESLLEFRKALQLAHDATLYCIKLNPHFCPCHVWASRQLMALSFTYKGEDSSKEQSLVQQAQIHTRTAEKLSSAEDDEMLDPGFQPKSMNAARRKKH